MWHAMVNDFWVTIVAIRQWFQRVSESRMNIIDKLPTPPPPPSNQNRYHQLIDKLCYILFVSRCY